METRKAKKAAKLGFEIGKFVCKGAVFNFIHFRFLAVKREY